MTYGKLGTGEPRGGDDEQVSAKADCQECMGMGAYTRACACTGAEDEAMTERKAVVRFIGTFGSTMFTWELIDAIENVEHLK